MSIFTIINQTQTIEHDPLDPVLLKAQKLPNGPQTRCIKATMKEKSLRLRPKLEGNIEFKDVWFKFPTRSNFTLCGLSLKFEAGTNCAIVGTSGSGKSTIFQLLLRFYDIDQGSITIDGHDIRSIELTHLRSFFGLIKQEPELFNGTLKYNMRYNCQKTDANGITHACEVSNSTEFVEMHPEGLDRDVGNRGDVLSGGQKQRVTIARILVRNPKVFLFDEATSALDSNSEVVVQNAIEKIWENHSSLTIAHRFSTIKNCDLIFVIENGIVAEQGSYEQLMQQKGLFFNMLVE